MREIEPGEIVTISDTGVSFRRFAKPAERLAMCVFEHVYFANPASNVFGQNVQLARETLGEILSREAPVRADFVMPMPDSGRSAASGYARASGIPYREGIVPNRYVGRTFIKPTQEQRIAAVRLKLNVIGDLVRDKKLVIVDDSIVRGTTTKAKMDQIRRAGAKEIHLRISCPPIRHPCFFGVDFATKDQLIAHGRTVEEIRQFLGVDTLHFLTLDGIDAHAACLAGQAAPRVDVAKARCLTFRTKALQAPGELPARRAQHLHASRIAVSAHVANRAIASPSLERSPRGPSWRNTRPRWRAPSPDGPCRRCRRHEDAVARESPWRAAR